MVVIQTLGRFLRLLRVDEVIQLGDSSRSSHCANGSRKKPLVLILCYLKAKIMNHPVLLGGGFPFETWQYRK